MAAPLGKGPFVGNPTLDINRIDTEELWETFNSNISQKITDLQDRIDTLANKIFLEIKKQILSTSRSISSISSMKNSDLIRSFTSFSISDYIESLKERSEKTLFKQNASEIIEILDKKFNAGSTEKKVFFSRPFGEHVADWSKYTVKCANKSA
ncbi:MAG: hypothetical protein VX777_09550 [Chlamydiota bacterium]|nr:hypothetical protein [Chlamydiota bacterium]